MDVLRSEANILLVDDEINILNTLKYLLLENNYEVDFTHLPHKAIDFQKHYNDVLGGESSIQSIPNLRKYPYVVKHGIGVFIL